MFQLLIIYCTRINMAAPRVCAAYVFAYAYVIRSTRDAYCDTLNVHMTASEFILALNL